MAVKTHLVILKNIKPHEISSYYPRRTSKALDLLRTVAFKSEEVSSDLPDPAIVDSIKKLKNAVQNLRTKFDAGGYVTPIWKSPPSKKLELSQDQIQALAPILPNKTPHTGAHTLEDELIPQILFTLKILDNDPAGFDCFLKVIQHYPSIGVMVCEMLCDDSILEKAKPFLDEKSFEHKREKLFQTLKENPERHIALIHFVTLCKEFGKNIIRNDWSIKLKSKIHPADISSIAEVASSSTMIPVMDLSKISSKDVASVREGLSNSNVKIRKLDLWENSSINDRGWGIVGDIVKKHEVEELNFSRCGLRFKKVDAFSKSSGDCKIRKLDIWENSNIDKRGWGIIGDIVRKHKVEELDFNYCDLTLEKVDSFHKSSGDCKIRELDLRENRRIDDRGWEIVGDIVRKHEVEELKFSYCDLTFEKVDAFNKSSGDCKIRRLSLGYNTNIDDRGWGIVSDIVRKHKVEELDFTGCGLTFEKVVAFNESSGDCKIHKLYLAWNGDMDHRGWGMIGDIVRKQHEVEELNFSWCGLTFEKVDAFNKSSGDCRIRKLDLVWNRDIDDRGWGIVGDIARKHEVEELNFSYCDLTFEKVDAFNKSSGDCKFIKLVLALREDSDDGFLSGKFDAIFTAIAELSLKIPHYLAIDNFFPRHFHVLTQPEHAKRVIEGCVILQDFIHLHCTQRMRLELRWGYPDMDSCETSEQYIEKLELEKSDEISKWMQNPKFLDEFQTSNIFAGESDHIKLFPIETRISTYKSRFPKLKWERGEYETGSEVDTAGNVTAEPGDKRNLPSELGLPSDEPASKSAKVVDPNSSIKYSVNVTGGQSSDIRSSILKTLRISHDRFHDDELEQLSVALATAVEEFWDGKHDVRIVSDAIPKYLSEDDVIGIGKELEADHPLCSILLYRVACLTHQSKTYKPAETLIWLNERVCDFELVAKVIMDSKFEDRLRLIVIPILVKFVEDLLHDVRAIHGVNLTAKAMFEVDCIIRLSCICIDWSQISGTMLISPVIDLCKEGINCLENRFGTAVHKCSYYGLLLNNISKGYMKLSRPAQASYYLEKTLFVKKTTAYGSRKIRLQDLEETEDRKEYADKEESTSIEKPINVEYSIYKSKLDIKSLVLRRTPLQRALQIALEQFQSIEALTLSDSLVSGVEKTKKAEYETAVQNVKLAIPERLSAADVISIGMKLTEEHPLCSIILYRAASLLYLSKTFEPKDAVKWLNDRVSDLKNIAETVMDSDVEEKFRLTVSNAILKFEQDLVRDLLDIKNVNMNMKALFVADSIFSLSSIYVDSLRTFQDTDKSSSIIDLCEEGLRCLKSNFGVAVHKCNYYGLLLNAIGESNMLLDHFDEALKYLQKALFAKHKTAYGSEKLRSMDLQMTEYLIDKCKGGVDFVKAKIFDQEKSSITGYPARETFASQVEPGIKSEQSWSKSKKDTHFMHTPHGKIIPKREPRMKSEPKSIKTEPYSATSGSTSTTTLSSTTNYPIPDTPKFEQIVIKMEPSESISGFPISHDITSKMEVDEGRLTDDTDRDNRRQTFEFEENFDASIDNNALIDLSERLTVSTKSKKKLPFKLNEINSNNCFGITVLAKRAGDEDLFRDANKYVMENFKMISTSEAFKSLDMYHLKTFLENCDLSDTARLDLMEAKLSISEEIQTSGDEIQKSNLDFVKFFAAISTSHRNSYPNVRSYCHNALRHSLSDLNCLEMAIFAADYKLDELQIWAEHYVITNFYSVSVTSYPELIISKFCLISSIPIRMQRMLKGQSGPSYEMSALEEISSEWLLKQLRKLSSVKTKTIGVEGGVITLDGCSVTFPEEALAKDTKFTMSVNTDPRNYPGNGKAITPILSVEPSMVFEKQVTVKLPTCFSARDGQTLTVQLMSNHGSGWELDRDVELGSTYEISFAVSHFSDDVVVGQDTSNGRCRLLNDIFIQVKTGMITSLFYRFEKDGKDFKKDMRTKNCSSFSTRALRVKGNENDVIKLNIDLDEPDEINLPYDRWRPKSATMKLVEEELKKNSYSFNVNPGWPVRSLPSGSFVSGEYHVTLGSSNEPVDSTWVAREWPVTLDPERIDAPGQLIARTYVAGGVVNEHNDHIRTVVAGGVQRPTLEG